MRGWHKTCLNVAGGAVHPLGARLGDGAAPWTTPVRSLLPVTGLEAGAAAPGITGGERDGQGSECDRSGQGTENPPLKLQGPPGYPAHFEV